MSVVHVELPGRAYDIHIGGGLMQRVPHLLRPLLRRSRVVIITDSTVAEIHLPVLEAALQTAGIESESLSLPAGEATKSWQGLTAAVEWILDQKVERGDLVLALGGGVMGDLVGFATAIARRGIRFVQVPTTLLAQVDSSVGGKTGINTRHGKNLVGAFHQPALVVADTDALRTLPDRDFLAGYGEVVKYGLLGDVTFFEWLEANGPRLRSDDAALAHAVARACQMKADIVMRDETEQGDRALLNLGHTFGHALESATGYSDRLLHGEGVAIGCALAFTLSTRLGLCSGQDAGRVRAHLQRMGTKGSLADIAGDLPDADGLLALMAQDKKVQDGKLRFVLVRGIGQAFITADVPRDAVRAVLQDALDERG
ncbi:3-dehydroquinate synthase [Ketogulonicigenium robustum]|uniref:3-dehydroquinate synthase n=1 Tax=Ketogulonicigenium robustum TaxID=92947 RepID=A0A1W6NYM0_9RHOB|nr:3-dehydroquinate synthase [Ketogulonicigenium robustum]ARO14200.1 3-dehydroquinate synthase [Ketogulonicigenium robustum]